ncbi:hypothetical protein [Streptomyces sp. NPDC046685]|uniref:hypothetical protein n=1 Tax=Streptomyces sp. NPDC046685 TaxID=3157202 RepID=UPI0033E1DB41
MSETDHSGRDRPSWAAKVTAEGARPDPASPVTRELLLRLIEENHAPLVTFLARRTGDFPTAEDLAEKVFVATARETACRTPSEWITWLHTTAVRAYDDFFLESCGIRP